MKKMKLVLSVLLFCVAFTGFSQKVKFKKDKAIIDDVETYNAVSQGTTTTLATLNSVEFVVMITNWYDEKNPAHFNKNNPQAYRYPEFIKKAFVTVRFLKSGKELHTELSQKEIVKSIFTSGLVDAEGNVNEEKENVFVNKYNNENLKYKLVN